MRANDSIGARPVSKAWVAEYSCMRCAYHAVLCTPRFMECKCRRSGSQQPGKIALECQRPGVLTVGPELSPQIAPASLQHDTWQLAWEASMTSTMRPIDVTEPAAPKGTAVLGESEPSGMCGAEFM